MRNKLNGYIKDPELQCMKWEFRLGIFIAE